MRLIGHSLLVFMLIAFGSAAFHLAFEWLETTDFLAGPNGVRVSRSTAYRVSDSQWLEFGITERGPVRILSNCAFSHPVENATRYAVDYELLDSSGQVIQSGRYHHRAQISLLSDPTRADRRLPLSRTSYADTQLPGSNSAEFWIEAPDLDVPGRLRIRIAERDTPIVEIAARAYQRTQVSPRKANSAWQRLSRRKRERLARSFAVPSDWLEPFETTALAGLAWHALGPKGVENQDYEERVLLIVNDPAFGRHPTRTSSPVTTVNVDGGSV
jgi:hypothetical protein